jgi:hypothetical protein
LRRGALWSDDLWRVVEAEGLLWLVDLFMTFPRLREFEIGQFLMDSALEMNAELAFL